MSSVTEMMLPQRTYVYRVFNTRGRLLYVGMSSNPVARMSGHSAALWFPDIASITVERHPSRYAAKVAEDEAIRTEWPLWNRQGSPDQFLVCQHDPLGGSRAPAAPEDDKAFLRWLEADHRIREMALRAVQKCHAETSSATRA